MIKLEITFGNGSKENIEAESLEITKYGGVIYTAKGKSDITILPVGFKHIVIELPD